MEPPTTPINCAEACVNGCILGDRCPHRENLATVSNFIENTSLDRMLEMAEAAVRRKMMERMSAPPQWVVPDESGNP